jgi:hypothetical protein
MEALGGFRSVKLGALLVLFGLVSAFVFVGPAGSVNAATLEVPSTAAAASFRQPIELGGLDLVSYCRTKFGGSLGKVDLLRSRAAYSWRCTTWGGGFPWGVSITFHLIDYDEVCHQQYHGVAYARPLRDNDANSWRCFEDVPISIPDYWG